MRPKTLKLVVTFHTTAAAMAMEALCKAQNLPGRLIPTPRELTADCGMAWCAPLDAGETLRALASASVSSSVPTLGTAASQSSSTALMDFRTSPPQP